MKSQLIKKFSNELTAVVTEFNDYLDKNPDARVSTGMTQWGRYNDKANVYRSLSGLNYLNRLVMRSEQLFKAVSSAKDFL
jgi:hypothetical protein